MASFFSWQAHPEVGDFVKDNYSQMGVTDLCRAIQNEYQVSLSPGAVRGWYSDWRIKNGTPTPPSPETVPVAGPDERFPDRRIPPSAEDNDKFYDWVTQEAERAEAEQLGQTHCKINMNTKGEGDLPVGICFWSDWQIGTRGVLYRQLQEDAQTIAETEGLYTFPMGDLVQNLNQRKHPSSLHECVLPDPNDQIRLATHILTKAENKLLGMVNGNHEDNAKQAAGLTITDKWCEQFKVPYLWHGARVEMTLGKQNYILGLRHKFKNESSINTTNVQRNIHMLLWPDADVVCLGHRHFNDMQKTPKPLGDTVWLRAGTYQKWCDYAMSIGGYKGNWGIPIVILYPKEKKVLPFYGKDFHTALEILQDQRRRYQNQ